MQGVKPGGTVSYGMSPWAIALLIVDIIGFTAIAAGTVWVVMRAINAKKYPDKYQESNKTARAK